MSDLTLITAVLTGINVIVTGIGIAVLGIGVKVYSEIMKTKELERIRQKG